MKKTGVVCLFLFLLSPVFCMAAGPLDDLTKYLPDSTFGFVGSSGTDNFDADFKDTSLGQIWNDPQVQSFFNAVLETAVKSNANGQAEEILAKKQALQKQLTMVFKNPVILALDTHDHADATALRSDDLFCTYFLAKVGSNKAEMESLIAEHLKPEKFVAKQMHGYQVYEREDDFAYYAFVNDVFVFAYNDYQYKLIQTIKSGGSNYAFADAVNALPQTQDALAGCVDFGKIIAFADQMIGEDDQEASESFNAFMDALGIKDVQKYAVRAGFSGKNLIAYGRLEVPTSKGIFQAYHPIDKSLLQMADGKAMQAGVVNVDYAVAYDCVVNAIKQVDKNAEKEINEGLVGIESQLGFSLKEGLLDCLEGNAVGYAMPAYVNPAMPMGGGAGIIKIKNKEKLIATLDKVGQLIEQNAEGQFQVSDSMTASGKQVNVWGVSFLAMMQVMPSWAIEGDYLAFSTHPTLTGNILDQIENGFVFENSVLANPDFSSLVNFVPDDAFALGLIDSKQQSNQIMIMLQQFWPMMKMGMQKQGMSLPIMLPSLTKYINEMEPAVQYGYKTADSLEWFYSGSGMDALASSTTGTAMVAAILMPALSKTKITARRVVSGTNLKGIGTACFVYAQDHDGRYPEKLEELIKECDLSPKSLVSPRKPKNSNAPSYILIQGVTSDASAGTILVYENPDFVAKYDMLNVLFADGHVQGIRKQQFKKELEKAYETMKKPMPEYNW